MKRKLRAAVLDACQKRQAGAKESVVRVNEDVEDGEGGDSIKMMEFKVHSS